MECMFNYKKDEPSERHFLFVILGTFYSEEFCKVVRNAYKHMSAHYKSKDDDLIALTPEMKKIMKNVISYKSK